MSDMIAHPEFDASRIKALCMMTPPDHCDYRDLMFLANGLKACGETGEQLYSAVCDEDEKQKDPLGRVYSRGFQSISKKMRKTVIKNRLVQIDIVNAAPALILNHVRKAVAAAGSDPALVLPVLSSYVEDRDAMLAEMQTTCASDRKSCKTAVLRVINGSGNVTLAGKPHSMLVALKKEMSTAKSLLRGDEVYNTVMQYANSSRGYLFALYFRLERQALEIMAQCLTTHTIFAYIHDAIVIDPTRPVDGESSFDVDLAVEKIEAALLRHFGVVLRVEASEIEPEWIPYTPPPGAPTTASRVVMVDYNVLLNLPDTAAGEVRVNVSDYLVVFASTEIEITRETKRVMKRAGKPFRRNVITPSKGGWSFTKSGEYAFHPNSLYCGYCDMVVVHDPFTAVVTTQGQFAPVVVQVLKGHTTLPDFLKAVSQTKMPIAALDPSRVTDYAQHQLEEWAPGKHALKPFQLKPGNRLYVAVSPCGSGKSHTMKLFVREQMKTFIASKLKAPVAGQKPGKAPPAADKPPSMRICCISGRVQQSYSTLSLLEDLGFKNYKEVDNIHECPLVIIQFQSLFRLRGALQWDLVIIDEVRLVMSQRVCAKTNGTHLHVNNTIFSTLMRNAPRHLWMDAGAEIDGSVAASINEYFPNQWEMVRYRFPVMARKVVYMEQYNGVQCAIECLLNGGRVAMVFQHRSGRHGMMAIMRIVKAELLDAGFDMDAILCIEKETPFSVISKFRNPDTLLAPFKLLAYTSKLLTGADIKLEFNLVINIASGGTGGASGRDLMQMDSRLRNLRNGLVIHCGAVKASKDVPFSDFHERITDAKACREALVASIGQTEFVLSETGAPRWRETIVTTQMAWDLVEREENVSGGFMRSARLCGWEVPPEEPVPFDQEEYLKHSGRCTVAETMNNAFEHTKVNAARNMLVSVGVNAEMIAKEAEARIKAGVCTPDDYALVRTYYALSFNIAREQWHVPTAVDICAYSSPEEVKLSKAILFNRVYLGEEGEYKDAKALRGAAPDTAVLRGAGARAAEGIIEAASIDLSFGCNTTIALSYLVERAGAIETAHKVARRLRGNKEFRIPYTKTRVVGQVNQALAVYGKKLKKKRTRKGLPDGEVEYQMHALARAGRKIKAHVNFTKRPETIAALSSSDLSASDIATASAREDLLAMSMEDFSNGTLEGKEVICDSFAIRPLVLDSVYKLVGEPMPDENDLDGVPVPGSSKGPMTLDYIVENANKVFSTIDIVATSSIDPSTVPKRLKRKTHDPVVFPRPDQAPIDFSALDHPAPPDLDLPPGAKRQKIASELSVEEMDEILQMGREIADEECEERSALDEEADEHMGNAENFVFE